MKTIPLNRFGRTFSSRRYDSGSLTIISCFCRFAVVFLFLASARGTFAGVLYVDANGANATPPFSSWSTAATNIQDAVNAASVGDQILVTNGVYATGVSVAIDSYPTRTTNRVAVYKPLTLASVNGPRFTVIDGGSLVRCLYLTNGASLVGFTLTNGNALDGSSGGGVLCDGAATASNCVFSGNTASAGGGGSGGTFFNCVFEGNTAATNSDSGYDSGNGGGVDNGILYNCLLTTNTAVGEGGGAYQSVLCNCTVVANSPDGASGYVYAFMGAYIYPSYAYNSIFYSNSVSDVGVCVIDHCCLSETNDISNWLYFLNPPPGCMTNDPVFVDAAAGDFHLQTNSPCIDAGTNIWVGTASDLDGTLRIANVTVDMGAYEHQNPAAPHLALQPSDDSLTAGATKNFRVVAGGVAPLGYQWSFKGTPLGGATNAILPLQNLAAAQSGNYQVTVSNAFGVVNSRVAVLVVTNPIFPQITVQPANQVGVFGANASFQVSVSGAGPLTYQWRFNGTNIPNNIMSTVAGIGVSGFSGDNGPAVNAILNNPLGLAVDSAGNVFIADEGNHRVRRVGPNGIITTVAGTGASVYSGEGGAATNAALDPAGVALDGAGNLLVADQANGGLRKIAPDGIITTVADGFASPSGLAIDAPGNLWVADTGNNRIVVVATNGSISTVAGNGASRGGQLYEYGIEGFFSGDGWMAANAVLYEPSSVAVSGQGNWFISDSGNERVREVDNSGVITTVAGDSREFGYGINPANDFAGGPRGICVDAWGDLFIADSYVEQVLKLDPFGALTTVAGNGENTYSGDGGVATNASLYGPTAVTFDSQGNLYIADTGNQAIRKVTFQGPNFTLTNPGAGNIGNYDVVVTSPYGSVTSAVATLTIPALPPVITSMPSSQSVLVGGNVLFSVTATGTAPLGYQWYFNGHALSDGARVTGSATSALAVADLAHGDAGDYDVIVTNLFGSATGGVILTVVEPVAITSQPLNQNIANGGVATFTVVTSGTGPFTYQWRHNGTNLVNNLITTVAGNGTAGYSGDGAAAINASLRQPQGATVDAAGNLYIADFGNNRIRKVDTNGVITTVAGNGAAGFSGDGGAATNASLNGPYDVRADAMGNLLIADWNNHSIRRVDTNGVITTIAGDGFGGYSGTPGFATNVALSRPQGVALDAAGNLLIADTYNDVIRKVDATGILTTVAGNGIPGDSGDLGLAVNATLYLPVKVSADAAGNVFIAEWSGNRVRKVNPSGIISSAAGTGAAGYSGDGGPASAATFNSVGAVGVDFSGNLFIADSGNNVVREVTTNGTITTVAGNGGGGYSGDGSPATAVSLNFPVDVALNARDDIFITDQMNNRIRKVTAPGPTLTLNNVTTNDAGDYEVVVTSPFGSVTSSVVTLTIPATIATLSPNQYVPAGGNAVLSATSNGQAPFGYQWYFDGQPLDDDGRVSGAATGVLSIGDVTHADAGDYEVVITNLYGSATGTVALLVGDPVTVTSEPANQYATNAGRATFTVTVSGTGPFTYQWQFNGVNLPTNLIATVAGNGFIGDSGDGGPAIQARLRQPQNVGIDALGNVFIADTGNFVFRRIDANGTITRFAGNGATGHSGDGGPATSASVVLPTGIAADNQGGVILADYSRWVRRVNSNGIITTVAGNGVAGFSGDGGSATNASLNVAADVAVDASGNLFIADLENNRVRKVDTNGIITTVAGNGTAGFSGDGGPATNASLNWIVGVAVDAGNNLFIADQVNNRIRRVDANGIITTVAGNGSAGYSGDGAAAVNASLNRPSAVAVDPGGNLFIADYGNNLIRKVTISGVISTLAGNGGGGYSGDGVAATATSLGAPFGVAVDGSGNLFIAELENNRIREVIAPGPALTLNNVTNRNGGNYDVVVTSPYGSVTSSVASLTVGSWPAPVIRSVTRNNGAVTLTWSAVTGLSYRVQYSTALNPVNWINLGSPVMATGPTASATDATIGANGQRFYRVFLPP